VRTGIVGMPAAVIIAGIVTCVRWRWADRHNGLVRENRRFVSFHCSSGAPQQFMAPRRVTRGARRWSLSLLRRALANQQ